MLVKGQYKDLVLDPLVKDKFALESYPGLVKRVEDLCHCLKHYDYTQADRDCRVHQIAYFLRFCTNPDYTQMTDDERLSVLVWLSENGFKTSPNKALLKIMEAQENV